MKAIEDVGLLDRIRTRATSFPGPAPEVAIARALVPSP